MLRSAQRVLDECLTAMRASRWNVRSNIRWDSTDDCCLCLHLCTFLLACPSRAEQAPKERRTSSSWRNGDWCCADRPLGLPVPAAAAAAVGARRLSSQPLNSRPLTSRQELRPPVTYLFLERLLGERRRRIAEGARNRPGRWHRKGRGKKLGTFGSTRIFGYNN